MRWLQGISVMAVILAAIVVFQIKYRADAVAARVSELQRQVDEETERLSLLKAEWSYLIQPGRIQGLVERHNDRLDLQPVDPAQIGRIRDLPMRAADGPGAGPPVRDGAISGYQRGTR